MVFILGFSFQETRLIKNCLEALYGVGPQHSARILAKFSIFPSAKIGTIPNKTIAAIEAELSTMTVENELRRKVQDNIQRLRDMGTYRGRRHAMGLPARGQNTRSQIMTARKLNRVHKPL